MKNFVKEFVMFGFKQAYACLFGGTMLALIIISKIIWQPEWVLERYDFLFLAAILIQITFLAFKLETISEAKVIFLFHIVGTVMEIFKTYAGSWSYPEAAIFRIGGVPLFSGFMYSCVGSYIARANKIQKQEYKNYPPLWATWLLCAAIYINFFTHHYIMDFRFILFAATFFLFFRTQVYFTVDRKQRKMPLLLGFVLIAFFIWIAENIGTFSGTWVYANQRQWELVRLNKIGAWFLLMIISFVLVTIVHRPRVKR